MTAIAPKKPQWMIAWPTILKMIATTIPAAMTPANSPIQKRAPTP